MERDRMAARLAEIRPVLDERAWRLLLGAEARAVGYGGMKMVAAAALLRRSGGRPTSPRGRPNPDQTCHRRTGALGCRIDWINLILDDSFARNGALLGEGDLIL
jgi:hypothetical protein